MSNYRHLAPSAYLVAFLLFAIPFFDALMSVAPWHVTNTTWRFGSIGLLSNALMIPAAGALVAVVTAVTFEHPRVQRVLGIVSWALVLVILASLGFFFLDAIQSRPMIRSEMMLSYQVATTTATVKLFLGAVTFFFLGRACLATPRLEAVSGSPLLLNKRDLDSS